MGRDKKTNSNELTEEERRRQRWERFTTIAKFALLLLIVVGIPGYFLVINRDLVTRFNSYQEAVHYLQSFHGLSIAVFLAAQVFQVVVFVLPGEVFQFAAGSLFGIPLGLLLSLTGSVAGTAVAYGIARFLGKDAVRMMAGDEKMDYYIERLNSERAYIIVFLLYLIPGMPKDLLCYLAGVSDMKFRAFLLLSNLARIPGMLGSLIFGSMFMQKDYKLMIIFGIIVAVILLLCFIFKKKLMAWIDRIYEKIK